MIYISMNFHEFHIGGVGNLSWNSYFLYIKLNSKPPSYLVGKIIQLVFWGYSHYIAKSWRNHKYRQLSWSTLVTLEKGNHRHGSLPRPITCPATSVPLWIQKSLPVLCSVPGVQCLSAQQQPFSLRSSHLPWPLWGTWWWSISSCLCPCSSFLV